MAISSDIKVIAIGASTGGPEALQKVITRLSRDFDLPILIVQHIAEGFLGGMVEWLGRTAGRNVRVASDREHITGGTIYFAPDGFDMGVSRGMFIVLSKNGSEGRHMPSVSYLFRSVDRAFRRDAVGIILSGMGRDGVKELRQMKDHGAVTIAQDRESSIVYGMPKAALDAGAVSYVLPPESIAGVLNSLSIPQKGRNGKIREPYQGGAMLKPSGGQHDIRK